MAAAFATTASALSIPNHGLSSRGGAAGLSSGNAFQTTSIVQPRPVTSRAHRVVAARASLGPTESKAAARREVLASILAAGAALGFGGRAVADPMTQASEIFKTKAVELGLPTAAPFKLTPVGGPGTNFSRTSEQEGVRDFETGETKPSPDAKNSAYSAKSNLQSSLPSEPKGVGEQAKESSPSLPEAPSLPDVSLPKPELPQLPELPKVDLPKFGN